MGRELKFRAWDIEWHTFEYFEIGENDDCYGIFRHATNKFGSIVEQYTGLKDKDGEEIYEGDIVEYGARNITTVRFENGGFYPFAEGYNDFGCPHGEDVEVIGNIHESNMEELCPKE